MGFVNSWSYLPCEFIIFEGDFYTFPPGFVGRNSCVHGVAQNIYLLSFVALVLVMLRAAYLLHTFFYLHFSFFIKRIS